MARLLDFSIHEAVEQDGQPREAAYDDGITRMLFRDGGIVRSCELEEWPTVQAALQAAAAARVQAEADAAAIRTHVLALAQSAVGVSLGALTAAQRNALIAALLWRAGALNPDLTVKPLGQWLER